MALDGVVNSVMWAGMYCVQVAICVPNARFSGKPSQYWPEDWLSSTEDTYKWFLLDCTRVCVVFLQFVKPVSLTTHVYLQAGPNICPLARLKGEDSLDLEKRIDAFLDELYTNPLPVPFADRPGYLTAGGVTGELMNVLGSNRSH